MIGSEWQVALVIFFAVVAGLCFSAGSISYLFDVASAMRRIVGLEFKVGKLTRKLEHVLEPLSNDCEDDWWKTTEGTEEDE
jgi:hypothetical protein